MSQRKKSRKKFATFQILPTFAPVLENPGALAHLARAFDWQSRGGEFESRMLHKSISYPLRFQRVIFYHLLAKMKHLVFPIVLGVLFLCSCNNSKTNQVNDSDTQSETQESPIPTPNQITAEMAFEGVNNYCHKNYDWSVAEENPDMMYVQMGDETDSTYQVVFRSYTGAFVYFHVDKANGTTKMVEKVPNLGIEAEAGTIELSDYLDKKKD